MKNKATNTILWVLGYSIPVFLSVGLYLSGQLKRELVRYLDESLLVQMKVEEIRFTGLESFPNVGVTLYNVRIDESFPAFKSNLVSAGSVEIRVNPFSLFYNQISVRKLLVNQATFRIYNGVEGNTNYAIFKTSESDSSRLKIDFDNLHFKNCRLIYLDEKDLISCNSLFYSLKAKGSIGEEKLDLDLSFDALFDHIRLGDERYLVGKHANWASELHINKTLGSCNIASAEFGMEGFQVDVKGDILMVNSVPDLDLNFTTDKLQVQGIISLLPKRYTSAFGRWNTEGDFSLNGTVQGRIDKDVLPKMRASFQVKNGNISGDQGTFRDMDIQAEFGNGDGSTQISMKGVVNALHFNNSGLQISFQSEDITNGIDIEKSEIQLDLNDLIALFPQLQPYKLKGLLGLEVAGKLKYQSDVIPNMTGAVKLSNGSVIFPGTTDALNFDLVGDVRGDDLVNTKANIGLKSDQILLEGDLQNFTGFWLSIRPLWVGDLTAQSIDLSKWIADDSTRESIPEVADLDIGLDIKGAFNLGKMNYAGLTLSDVSGDLEYSHDKIFVEDVEFGAWNGVHKLSLHLQQEGNYYKMLAKGNSVDVDLKELFREFKDFDQTEITYENLSGLLSTTYDLSALLDPGYNLIERELFCSADVGVKNGRLTGYKPLEELSIFLELEDLKDISFADLRNRLEIRNGIIFLPETELKNTALNLSVSGTHTMENYLDYHIKVKVTDVLAKRSKWVEKKNAKRLEEGRDGGLTAYVKMTGTPEELKISYDSKSAGREFRSKFKEERKSFFKEVGREIRGERTETQDKNKVNWIE